MGRIVEKGVGQVKHAGVFARARGFATNTAVTGSRLLYENLGHVGRSDVFTGDREFSAAKAGLENV
ncbi:MAG: hypothetical protein H6656_02580 [Ardenticatenaceae bacterium]|nr:hypothetical protein [Ardenticatenaceae bacterium]